MKDDRVTILAILSIAAIAILVLLLRNKPESDTRLKARVEAVKESDKDGIEQGKDLLLYEYKDVS